MVDESELPMPNMNSFCFVLFSFNFSWSTVVYNALVSGVQQSESAIHTHIHSFLDSFPK